MNDKNKFQQGNVILISFAHFVHDVYSSFLAPILPLLIEKFNSSLATHFSSEQTENIISACDDQEKLESMAVNDFLDLWIRA